MVRKQSEGGCGRGRQALKVQDRKVREEEAWVRKDGIGELNYFGRVGLSRKN